MKFQLKLPVFKPCGLQKARLLTQSCKAEHGGVDSETEWTKGYIMEVSSELPLKTKNRALLN